MDTIFDMHIHSRANLSEVNAEDMLKRMEEAGVYGGCVISQKPSDAVTFQERLDGVMAWAEGYEDRIYPILWLHPYEDDVINKIHIAVERGICGFKFICTDYFVYEEHVMEVLREIAKTGKPVIFHTGILWDAKVSSEHNRPLDWEALLDIEGLRFSMGHCSWPWVDECIALYGKFLDAMKKRNTSEMFLDLTPGTPDIYREELLTKLYTIGYDVGNNVMFGTDGQAQDYSPQKSARFLKLEEEILDKLGVSAENRRKLYHDNLMRFLGKTSAEIGHFSPVLEAGQEWSPVNKEVSGIIERWYKELEFPGEYDGEFYRALKRIPISDAVTAERLNVDGQDGQRNLLTCLYLCEELEKWYEEKGISREILIDTLKDIVYWTEIWSEIKGELYLGELHWLKWHLQGKLFRLGRLQFCMGSAEADVPDKGLKHADRIVEVHIPAGDTLKEEACIESIQRARNFFEMYFPEYSYRYFTCSSWLLDSNLKDLLKPESNIYKFQNMFQVVSEKPSHSILKYIFKWNATPGNIRNMFCRSELAMRVRDELKKGRIFHESLGLIEK